MQQMQFQYILVSREEDSLLKEKFYFLFRITATS